jgi:hypothetical protein
MLAERFLLHQRQSGEGQGWNRRSVLFYSDVIRVFSVDHFSYVNIR